MIKIGRNKKFPDGTDIMSISMPKSMFKVIDKNRKDLDMKRSEYVVSVLQSYGMKEIDYCKMMARIANQDMHYWLAKVEIIEKGMGG